MSIQSGDVKGVGAGTRVSTRVHKHTDRTQGVRIDRPGHTILLRVQAVLEKLSQAKNTPGLWRLARGRLTSLNLSPVLNRFGTEIAGIDDWHLTSRQFRRYFAIFFIRRFEGPEDALRRAFHHVTNSSIQSYIGDRDGAEYLLSAKRDLAEEIYVALANDRPTYGSMGSTAIQKEMKEYAASNLPLEEIEREMKRKLAVLPLEVWPTVWGYCMLQKDDHLGAMCGSKGDTPIALEMFPGNCGRCQHLVVGKDQVGFWRQIAEVNRRIVENGTSVKIAREAALKMIQIVDSVLARMPGESWDGRR